MNSKVELADMLESVILEFRDVLNDEIKKIGKGLKDGKATAHERLKACTDFFKLLQGVELISQGIRKQREQESGKQLGILEFRRDLEAQIARLVDAEATQPVSGGTDK